MQKWRYSSTHSKCLNWMTASVQPHTTVALVVVRALWQAAWGPQPVWIFREKKKTHIPCPKTNIGSSDVQPKGQLSTTPTKLSRFLIICCFFTLYAGLLARSQYSEGPATGHLGTGFSWFPCVYKQMLRWFPRFQVATTCFSCSPPDLNLLVTNFIFCIHVK